MSTCPRCQMQFHCSVVDGVSRDSCWCMRLPPLKNLPVGEHDPDGATAACLCPDCLQSMTDSSEENTR